MSKTNTEDDAFNTVRIDVSSSPFLLDDKSVTILRMAKKRVEIFFSQVFRLEKKKWRF